MTKKNNSLEKQKELWSNSLTPLKSKKIRKFDFVGFDVETHTDKNTFLLGGLYFYRGTTEKRPVYKVFYKREEMIKYIIDNKKYFQRKYFIATNLEFDFTVLFKGTKYWNMFNLLYRGASLIMCSEKIKHKHGRITFIDTMNYIPFGVGKWGKILGYDKLPMPSSWEKKYFCKNEYETEFKIISNPQGYDTVLETVIPRKPKNEYEKQELENYNKRDCKISCDAMYLLQKGFNNLGGQMKITSASSSMDIFRRQYLQQQMIKESHILKDDEVTDFLFQSYYGGRTEVFKKGEYQNLFYYDINSLYPSVMKDYDLPLPQSIQKIRVPQEYYINSKMGVSEVVIECPETIDKPLLPVRHDGKLVFPTGLLKGTWTHAEINKAIIIGYKIKKVLKQYVYHRSFSPFKKLITEMYNLRLEQKKNKNPLQQATKLVMNSLYGKFGMRKVTKTKILQHQDITQETIDRELEGKEWSMQGDYIVYRQEEKYEGKYQFPIIASYITSYARLRMYEYVRSESVIYTDTDSVVTTKNLEINSKELGEMKLEGTYKKGFFVRPKFYMLLDSENGLSDEIKIKGIARANQKDFDTILKAGVVNKWKFNRLRESMIQNKEINAVSVNSKFMGLDDNKRTWDNDGIQSNSKPINLNMEMLNNGE